MLALLLAGCGPNYDNICQEMVDCAGGNEQDVDACIRQAEQQGEIADIEGCDSEWADFVACYEESASCQSENTGIACSNNGDCTSISDEMTCGATGECVVKRYGLKDDKDCEVETRAYGRCNEYGG